MSFSTYLNPFNSLFAKIFLWFWLTTLLLMFGVAYTMHQLLEWRDPIPATPVQVKKIERLAKRLNKQIENRGRLAASRLAENNVFLIDAYGNTLGADPDNKMLKSLKEFANQDYIQQKYSDGIILIGPINILYKGRDRQLFYYHKANSKHLKWLRNTPLNTMRVGLSILVSGILSFLLAWSITKPIGRLRAASNELSQGNLSARVDTNSTRKDEIGLLAADFNAMAGQIEALIKSQQNLLALTSHELRSPLTRMGVALAIAEQSSQEQSVCLQRIEKEMEHLNQLIGQILHYSHLENNMHTRIMTKVDISAVLEKIIANAEFETQGEREIRYHRQAYGPVDGDENLLSSAFENIIRNALKYTPKDSLISIDLALEQNTVVVTVKDDGPGIDLEFLDKIFEPFVRKDYNSTGYGLGLAITKKIINQHKGEISVTNHEQGGAVFTIKLPLSSA